MNAILTAGIIPNTIRVRLLNVFLHTKLIYDPFAEIHSLYKLKRFIKNHKLVFLRHLIIAVVLPSSNNPVKTMRSP